MVIINNLESHLILELIISDDFYFHKGAFTMTEVHLFLREATAEADKANLKKTRRSKDHAATYVGLDQLLTQLMNNARSEYQRLLNQVEGGDN